MRVSKRGQSVIGVGGSFLQLVVLVLSAWPALLAFAAAAEPPNVNRPAQDQPSTAMRRQETKTELHRLVQEARKLERARKLPEAIAAGEKATHLARGLYGDDSEAVAALQDWLARLHESARIGSLRARLGKACWQPARSCTEKKIGG